MANGEDATSIRVAAAPCSAPRTPSGEITLSLLTTIMKRILLKFIHFYFPPLTHASASRLSEGNSVLLPSKLQLESGHHRPQRSCRSAGTGKRTGVSLGVSLIGHNRNSCRQELMDTDKSASVLCGRIAVASHGSNTICQPICG